MEKSIGVYSEKLKNYYNAEGKLIQYPSKRPMRIMTLAKIAERFEQGKKYTEKDVNEVIRASIAFSDIELIRRELFQYKFVGRLKDGSEYWSEENWREVYKEYIE